MALTLHCQYGLYETLTICFNSMKQFPLYYKFNIALCEGYLVHFIVYYYHRTRTRTRGNFRSSDRLNMDLK